MSRGEEFTWLWIGTDGGPHPYAGYFCSSECRDGWRDRSDEEARLKLIFGDAAVGIQLLADLREGGQPLTIPDPKGVPRFRELDMAQAAIYREDRKSGRQVPTGKIARFLLLGWREPLGGGMPRTW